MSKKPIKNILVTIGDAAGVGPEIIAKALADERLRKRARIFILGNHKVFLNFWKLDLIKVVTDLVDYSPSCLNIINVGKISKIVHGVPTVESARLAIDALNVSLQLIKKHNISAVVTAPIYKKGMLDAGFAFPGHTEFFSTSFRSKVLMSFWSDRLKVATITTHLPLKDVAININKKSVEDALKIAFLSLKSMLGKDAISIAVLGLNPHAGEDGKLGDEEKLILTPVCDDLREKGYNIYGPLPADTAFYQALQGKFDLVVGMYHDQVLAPFKMLYFDKGVNMTLGLPFVRTSPDHGTAFDIAGKGIASAESMKKAIEFAIKFAK